MYNPVYSLPTILLLGCDFFGLAAEGHGRIMESREPLKLVKGVMMAIAEHAVKQGGIKTAH